MRLSVVIATYNRRPLLERLLAQLARQTLPPGDFEVVVVDDGSAEPVAPHLQGGAFPYALTVETQANAGAAAARHRGVLRARAPLLVFLDDDMQVPEDFLAAHLAAHEGRGPRVVLGRMRPDAALPRMPLFERWHQRLLDRMAEQAREGTLALRGNHLFTGNVSLPREDYLAVGGFDVTLGHSEDAELGLRLEKRGLSFVFSEEACSVHGSDHTSLAFWRRRAQLYGRYDTRIARKHPDAPHASPWRFLSELNALSRPFTALALRAPRAAGVLAGAAVGAARAADRMRLGGVAQAGTTLAYALEYFRGVRLEVGPTAVREARAFARPPRRSGWAQLVEAVRADQAMMRRYEAKYGHAAPSAGRLSSDLVQRVGLQVLAGYRLMRVLASRGHTLPAKVVSRLIRLLYGSDVHWEAQLAPGVMVVHGMGMAISHQARVEEGCILFQHVTLGMGTDPLTRAVGAPSLERNVHVGPGATLLGPITVGEGSKVMAGVVLTHSVPPHSLVEAPAPVVRPRTSRAPVVHAGSGSNALRTDGTPAGSQA